MIKSGTIIKNTLTNDLEYYDYFQQPISKGTFTAIEKAVDYYTLEDLGAGEYDVEFYLNSSMIDSCTVVIKENKKFSEYGITSCELKPISIDQYLTNGSIINQSIFKQGKDTNWGCQVIFHSSKKFDEETNILFKLVIKGPEGEETSYHSYPITLMKRTFFRDFVKYLSCGKYTIEIYGDDLLLASTSYEIQKSSFSEVNPTDIKLELYKSDVNKEPTDKFNDYDILYYDFSFNAGNIELEETDIGINYRTKVVLKDGNKIVDEKNNILFIRYADSNRTKKFSNSFSLDDVEFIDQAKIEVYINDNLIISKPFEVSAEE